MCIAYIFVIQQTSKERDVFPKLLARPAAALLHPPRQLNHASLTGSIQRGGGNRQETALTWTIPTPGATVAI